MGLNRVTRVMREAGLRSVSRRRRVRTTYRREDVLPAPDLVDRGFEATEPDRLWVAEITYVPTTAGLFYLPVVLDAWSRRVVTWSMAPHLKTGLVLDALEVALYQRQPEGDIHHSDQGHPVHLPRLRPVVPRGRCPVLHRIGRRHLRQRPLREAFCVAGV